MKTWANLKFWQSQKFQEIQKLLEFKDYGSPKNPEYSPNQTQMFSALTETPYETVKAVILGQDPYPTRGLATGLAFSVPSTTKVLPPSLVNIFQEYTTDLHFPWPRSGDLSPWARNGVLLLNRSLTVAHSSSVVHRGLWDDLINEVLDELCNRKPAPVFILWGLDAKSVFARRDAPTVISAHPSPLSARKGFFGSRPFSTCNILLARSRQNVDWRLP